MVVCCERCSAKFTWIRKQRVCMTCAAVCCPGCVKRLRCYPLEYRCLRCVRLCTSFGYDRQQLQKLPVRDLLHIMRVLSLSSSLCREKWELVDIILSRDSPSSVLSVPSAASSMSAVPSSTSSMSAVPSATSSMSSDDFNTSSSDSSVPENNAWRSEPQTGETSSSSRQSSVSSIRVFPAPAVADNSEASSQGSTSPATHQPTGTSALSDGAEESDDELIDVVSTEHEVGAGSRSIRIEEAAGDVSSAMLHRSRRSLDAGVSGDASYQQVDISGGQDREEEDDCILVEDQPADQTSPSSPEQEPIVVDDDGDDYMEGAAEPQSEFDLSTVTEVGQLPSVELIDQLPVRRCKELLQRHRVSCRDALEKRELLTLLSELWHEARRQRDALAGATDRDLCTVCMDALIDCVLLECGHMVTCTACGKRMSDCPICRRLVSRAVHVFRT